MKSLACKKCVHKKENDGEESDDGTPWKANDVAYQLQIRKKASPARLLNNNGILVEQVVAVSASNTFL